MRPELIATDLDGTFLSPDGTVSADELRRACSAAQAAGIPVLFATGRPVRWLDVVKDLPGAHPTVIASNGAVLYDLASGELLDRICLDAGGRPGAPSVDIRSAVPDVSFAFESGTRFGYEPDVQPPGRTTTGNDPALFSGPAEEIAVRRGLRQDAGAEPLVTSPTSCCDRVRDAGRRPPDRHPLPDPRLRPGRDQRPGVNKASMLQRCCARLGDRRASRCRLRGHAQ